MTDAEKIQELTDALLNMMGLFDTPIARMKMKGDMEEEARESGRQILAKLGIKHPAST